MSNIQKDTQPVGGFMFYRSFRDAIRQLPRRQQLALYDAIADYALDGTIPDIDNKIADAMFAFIRPSIDRTKKTDLSQPARRGAPVGNHNAAKHKPQTVAATVSPNTVAASPPQPQKVEYAAALQRLAWFFKLSIASWHPLPNPKRLSMPLHCRGSKPQTRPRPCIVR